MRQPVDGPVGHALHTAQIIILQVVRQRARVTDVDEATNHGELRWGATLRRRQSYFGERP
jgi:hypothetical protein